MKKPLGPPDKGSFVSQLFGTSGTFLKNSLLFLFLKNCFLSSRVRVQDVQVFI